MIVNNDSKGVLKAFLVQVDVLVFRLAHPSQLLASPPRCDQSLRLTATSVLSIRSKLLAFQKCWFLISI